MKITVIVVLFIAWVACLVYYVEADDDWDPFWGESNPKHELGEIFSPESYCKEHPRSEACYWKNLENGNCHVDCTFPGCQRHVRC